MSRLSLTSLFSLSLLACSGNAEPEVVSSQLGRSTPKATTTWSAPPGSTVEAEVVENTVPEVVAVVMVPPESVEDLVDGEGDTVLEIEVRPGESLVLIAEWSGTTVEAIAEANGIRTGGTLYPGQLLEMDVDSETFTAMQDARDRFEDARLDRFLARRGSLVGVTTHTVGTGETAWQIARDHGAMPLWVLASFNRGDDLDRLRIGQELNLPMMGDAVVMDDEVTDEPVEVAEAAEFTSDTSPETEIDAEGTNSTNP